MYTTHNRTESIATLSAQAMELAELAAEAAQFDHPLTTFSINDEHWDNAEEDVEELLREEETAHTVSETHVTIHTIDERGVVRAWQSVIQLVDDTE